MLLHNTLTRKSELFEPLEKGVVKMYCCGPTVYNYAHIGNLRAFTFYDIVLRTLNHKGHKVTFVMNLTDVDDKTINGSRKEGVSLKEFTERYTKLFFEDLSKLNIRKADLITKATEYVPEMVDLTKRLMSNGMAYKGADGSIYYKVSAFPEYGKLSHFDIKQLKAGASGRVNADEYTKEQASDFALWKAWTPEDGDVFWETELGKGRPGWHTECSAMSMKHLGETLDIHCGGIDLMFPHHENEIAQSEGATGKQFVRYWLHNAHILVDGVKMSKSLGNFYVLNDLLQKGYRPEAIRYLFISSHYREQVNLTFKALDSAQQSINRIFDFVRSLNEVKSELNNPDVEQLVVSATNAFELALDNDLNTPQALSALFELIKETNKLIAANDFGKENSNEVRMAINKFDEVLGLLYYMEKPLPMPKEEIEKLVSERAAAKAAKDFAKGDSIRKQLKDKGIILEDAREGTTWKVA
ncbi:Cysteine--tRNA ligase [uncultured archaeon]|nr:Cysteine--tRNA ligase [uncultured archaeon]